MSAMDRFKNVAQIVVRHPERIGCAVAVLLVAVALLRTDWTPYSRSPDEFHERIDEALVLLETSVWPEEEQARFAVSDAATVGHLAAALLRDPIPVDAYLASQSPVKHPGRGTRTVREPDFVPVQQLIAHTERVLLELAPARESRATENPPAEPAPPEFRPDELRRRERRGFDEERATPPIPFDPSDEMLTSTGRISEREGRGYPYVSVRGLVDATAQVQAIVEATHRSRAEARKLFEIIDFELQRQTFLVELGGWSSWERVDVDVFRDVALSTTGFEPDVVSSAATDTAITCPLPARITGRWERLATHPGLTQFELTPAEIERELAYHRALLELARRKRIRGSGRIEKGGFHDLLQDARSLEEQLFATATSSPPGLPRSRSSLGISPPRQDAAYETLLRELEGDMEAVSAQRGLREWLARRATLNSRMLLFRYLDFDVHPGATYRYRVRLELRNPNHRRSLASADGAVHVVTGATRFTPWSEPTEAVTVEPLTRYFLAEVEPQRGREHPAARLELFQYDTGLGTIVREQLAVQFGQRVGGRARTILRDPAAGVYEESDYTFRSPDTLLDALADLTFDAAQHADLRLPPGSTRQAGIHEFALVLTGDDRLAAIDPASQTDQLDELREYMRAQDRLLDDLRPKSDLIGPEPDMYDSEIYEELYGPPGGLDDSPPPRRRNALQRNR